MFTSVLIMELSGQRVGQKSANVTYDYYFSDEAVPSTRAFCCPQPTLGSERVLPLSAL